MNGYHECHLLSSYSARQLCLLLNLLLYRSLQFSHPASGQGKIRSICQPWIPCRNRKLCEASRVHRRKYIPVRDHGYHRPHAITHLIHRLSRRQFPRRGISQKIRPEVRAVYQHIPQYYAFRQLLLLWRYHTGNIVLAFRYRLYLVLKTSTAFTVAFAPTVHPTDYSVSWKTNNLLYSIIAPSDSTTLNPQGMLTSLKGAKLLQGQSLTGLQLLTFTFETPGALNYADYYTFLHNPAQLKGQHLSLLMSYAISY